MASATWPSAIPLFEHPSPDSGFSMAPEAEATLHTKMTTGPGKSRIVYTKVPWQVSYTLKLSSDQWAALNQFYENDLAFGTQRFNYLDLVSKTTVEYEFITRPRITGALAMYWFTVELNMRKFV